MSPADQGAEEAGPPPSPIQQDSLSSVVVPLQNVTLESQAPASAAALRPVQRPLLPTACLSPAVWP